MINTEYSYSDLLGLTAVKARQAFRESRYSGSTAGLAAGHQQCNLVIIPAGYADAFYEFCCLNAQACPFIASSGRGAANIPELGDTIDLRTDLPRYCVYRDGRLNTTTNDISDLWRDDLVSFAIGCSFTFEHSLMAAGIPLRHVEQGTVVPMYETNRPSQPSPPFKSNLVMSMRPVPNEQIELVKEISSKYPKAHGTPMHVGDPAELGIANINAPDWGDSVEIRANETPVFWGCGVTTQAAIKIANLSLCITHAPGSMLVTDIDDKTATSFEYKKR